MKMISGAFIKIKRESVISPYDANIIFDDWKVPVISKTGLKTWMYPLGKIPKGWKLLWRIAL